MTHALTQFIQGFGYFGILIAMALESACIPLPSEVIMPFGGYLAWTGTLSLTGVIIAGTVGNVLGSIIAYYVGYYGGRPLIARYGQRLRISDRHIATAERWFLRHGEVTVLVARLLPIVRTFISLPAGISRMSFGKFVLYTLIGCIPWVAALGVVGLNLGHAWEGIRQVMHPFTYIVAVALVVLVVGYVIRRRRRSRR